MPSLDIYKLRRLNQYQQDLSQRDRDLMMLDDTSWQDPTSIEPTSPEQLRIDRGDPLPELDIPRLRNRLPDIASRTPDTSQDESYSPTRRSARDIYEGLGDIFSPETTSRDRLNRMIDEIPQRQEPNWARKLVASGMGIGSLRRKQDPIDTMEKVMYAPYIRDVASWKEKAEPAYKAAQLENTANVNERALAGNILTAETQSQRLESTERIAREKNEIALIRANAYAAKNNGAEVEIVDGVAVAKYNDGHVETLGRIPGTTSEAELANIRGKWNVKASRERGQNAVEIARTRGLQVMQDEAGNQYVVDPTTDERRPIGDAPDEPQGNLSVVGTKSQNTPRATQRGPNTLERNRMRQEKMRDLFELDPTVRNKIIIDNGDGTYTLTPRPTVKPESWWPGKQEVTQEDVDAWDAVKSEIDGTPAPQQQGNLNRERIEEPVPTKPTGRVVVQDPNGKKFTIPADQLDRFLKSPQGRGYRRVQ